MTTGNPTTRWKGCCMPCPSLARTPGDIEKEQWARKMQRLLRRACHATHLARGVPLEPRLIDQIRRRYDIIVTEGLAFHQDQPPLATPATTGKRRGPRRTISFCV
jgi:transposase